MFKEKIIIEMKEVFKEIPFGIEHTLKVLKNAEDIMKGENIGEEEKEFISIIAILHDIGAVEAQKKYGSIDGVYQEKEGPSNPQPIGFSGILLAKRQNSFYCTYFLHNRNVADTKSPYPIKRLEVIRWFNQKSMVFNQSLS